mgnify:CR=1 FL=1
MDLKLKNKTAIVCASSKGLGRAVAEGLANEGVNLTIFSRTEEVILQTAKEIQEKYDVSVLSIVADVSDENDLYLIVNETLNEYSGVDILINNAGGPPFGYFNDFDNVDWQNALNLNFLSAVNLTKKVVPYMKEKKWGRLINITSISVKQPIDGLILSNSARSALIAFAKTLSNELGEYNILVNNVCPGRIFTDRIKNLASQRAEKDGISFEDALDNMKTDIPLQRIGNPSEFANLVVFLASECASYITGNTIQIDGGLYKGI